MADPPRPDSLKLGPGRLLIAVYATFVLAAGARSAVQIATDFDEAELAYVLSAVAALVYIACTVALVSDNRAAVRICCTVELVGVLAVGTLSIVDSDDFPDATVWSDYGMGYLFLPLVLPVLGLLWLRRTSRTAPVA